ncbi:MAG: Rdx family protein [Pirellulales bacterium]|nr:Rdx family protein [Pirellulales bacterium]
MSLASRLLGEFKQQIESLELIPSGGGCFEFSAGNELIWSKLQTGSFPDEQKMVEAVRQKLPRR